MRLPSVFGLLKPWLKVPQDTVQSNETPSTSVADTEALIAPTFTAENTG